MRHLFSVKCFAFFKKQAREKHQAKHWGNPLKSLRVLHGSISICIQKFPHQTQLSNVQLSVLSCFLTLSSSRVGQDTNQSIK